MGRLAGSLRLRMTVGAGAIALVAVLAALLTAYAATETAARVESAVAAQQRMELMAALSARVGDYAVVAAEAAGQPGIGAAERVARLSSRAALVADAFARVEATLGQAVEAARATDELTQMERATRSIGVARMRAQFDLMARTLADPAFPFDQSALRAELDSFATRFSPALNEAIEAERRDRDLALASVEALRGRLISLGLGLAATALGVLALFHLALIRPLLARIQRIGPVTAAIGGGRFDTRLDIGRRDELGLLFAKLNRMAARLDRARDRVEADRAQLNEIIEERTRALTDANRRLAAVDAERRRLFSDVSHELRTPLTVIMAEAELGLSSEAVAEAEARSAFAVIRARGRRLKRRIDDMLRLARSESGQIDLEPAPFEVAAALADAAEDAEGLTKRRRIRVEVEAPAGLSALGDRDWTRQVISGLIDNAVRHSPDGSTIRLHAAAERGWVRIEVADQGSGVPAGEQERVFERFARAERTEPGRGFGVGLALARWIVERQGGEIRLASPAPGAGPDTDPGPGVSAAPGAAAGPGTLVTLRLPAHAGVAAAARGTSEGEIGSAMRAAGGGAGR